MILIFLNAIKAMIRYILLGFLVLYIFRFLSRILSQLPNPKNKPSDRKDIKNPRWNESDIQDASYTDIDNKEKK